MDEDVKYYNVNLLTVMALVINYMTDMDSNVIGRLYLTIFILFYESDA